MKKAFVMMLCAIALFGAEKSVEELEKENQILEMQLKNQKLKKELEEGAKSDEEKKADKVAEAKEILKEALKAPTKDEKRTSSFGGAGIGGVALSFPDWKTGFTQDEISNGFALEFQGGWITMWNRHFGIQYYFNTDLSFNNLFGSGPRWHSLHSTYTFNADAVLNAYNGDSFGIGFLLGIGAGLKLDMVSFNLGRMTYPVGFDARANLGLRLIFGSNFAIDFMARFPFTSQNLDYVNYRGEQMRYREVATYTVRFVGGRF